MYFFLSDPENRDKEDTDYEDEEEEEEEPELVEEDFKEPYKAPRSVRRQRREQRQGQGQPQRYHSKKRPPKAHSKKISSKMSGKEDKDNAKSDPVPHVFLRPPQADVDSTSGPQEYVYLSKEYRRLQRRDNILTEHKYWSIVVFTLCEADNSKVKAHVLSHDVQPGKGCCRIVKPKFSAFMFGSKLSTFADICFDDDGDASTGFSQSVKEHCTDNDLIVDVHFDEPIHTTVRRISESHIEFSSEAAEECRACGLVEIIDTPNVVVFEVEAIKTIHTAETTTRGQRRRARISE